VRANTPERLKNLLRPGVAASFEPTSDSALRLPVICDEQADIPQEPGSYRTAFRFDRPNLANDLLPLMTGKLISTLYEKENALLIPVEAVRYEGAEAFVEIFSPETNVTRRQEVQLGNKDAKRIEITSGLREGEHVVMP
jgi:multidrug efflux pump subunit AcrA (membrane-fusion protein)